jgi:hypothetical protein
MANTKLSLELHDELKSAIRMTYEEADLLFNPPEPPCCSICDGAGHGYPGAGPCPLENTMSWADVEREDQEYRQAVYYGELV